MSRVAEINRANSELALGVRQVAEVVRKVDGAAQSTREASQSLSSTAADLADRADSLRRTVGFFSVGGEDLRDPQSDPLPEAGPPEAVGQDAVPDMPSHLPRVA